MWPLFVLRHWRTILVLALFVPLCAAVPISCAVGRSQGKEREHARMEREAEAALAVANAKYRAIEDQHAKDIASVRLEYVKQQTTAEVADRAVVRDLNRGATGLRFKLTKCDPAMPNGGASPGGATGAPTGQLAPATAGSLYSIAGDGDTCCRQVNGLLDYIDKLVARFGRARLSSGNAAP